VGSVERGVGSTRDPDQAGQAKGVPSVFPHNYSPQKDNDDGSDGLSGLQSTSLLLLGKAL